MYKVFRFFVLVVLVCHCTGSFARLQGQAIVDSLLKELPRQKEDTNKVDILNKLSWEYHTINPDEGLKYGKQALALSERLKWILGVAHASNFIASNYFGKSDYPNVLKYLNGAVKMFEEARDKKNAAALTCNIATVYLMQGDYPTALEYLFKALKLDEEGGYKGYTATVTGNIAAVYFELKDYPKAMQYNLKALKLDEELGKKDLIASANSNIGMIYHEQKDYPKALEYLFKALAVYKELGSKFGIASTFRNLSSVYGNGVKNYTIANEYGQRALKLSEELGDKELTAHTLNVLGATYIAIIKDTAAKKGNNTEVAGRPSITNHQPTDTDQVTATIPHGKTQLLAAAIDYLQRALAVSKEINITDGMQNGYQYLSEAYKLKGDYKTAMQFQANYQAIKDSVFSAENNKSIIHQAVKYEFEKKEAITKVESEKELQKQKLVRNGFMGGFAVVLLFAGVFLNQRNKVKKEKANVEKEKARSDELLLNILPAEVAEELKEKGGAEAKLIDEVTVLFTDFKGFTQLTEKLTPKELVHEINDCFSAFDHIMQKHGIEKIKTIGDSYMAAGGLPIPNTTHALDVVKAALEIQQYMHKHKQQKETKGQLFFEIRIGVHTGPVVAGIVGVKKFQYDIWGDTVNTASRMESSGEVGKVNISGTTYELVKDKFNCEYRGEIEAKGKGVMKMYFVS